MAIKDNQYFALKKVTFGGHINNTITTSREIELLQQLSHENIINMVEIAGFIKPCEEFDLQQGQSSIVLPYISMIYFL